MREIVVMRWGFPPYTISGQKRHKPYVTNVRNTDGDYWQTCLRNPLARCLVPANSFAAPDMNRAPWPIWTWFARDESRPLMFFAGIWRQWEGNRGTPTKPDIGSHLVFSFLTTDANPDVARIHAAAAPVLLLDEEACDQWTNAPWEIARELQKTPPAGALKIVARDKKKDLSALSIVGGHFA